ncbi:hypothetical protein ACPCDX_27200 [Streptomyces koyangensis]|uniref:hypothetical protein n=1 Tax=Streptomyces koyangensis TaxID=188770 RepID=UPI003C2F2FB5
MTLVAIQPSYGNPTARRHWQETLEQEVPFASPKHADTLSPSQRDGLRQLHPSGSARFWGATSVQDAKVARFRTGDVVLFTGKNHVRGIGEVGLTFRNEAFANTMWEPDPIKGSWRNVYSLLSFRPTEIHYSEIWALPGFNHGDHFMGLRVLKEEQAQEILDGLGIDTVTEFERKLARDVAVASALAAGTTVIPVEAFNTPETTYTRSARAIRVGRAESLLVTEYKATLGGAEVQRLRTPAGLTDLHVTGAAGTEVIEAKSSAEHRYVREALAQLLDYAPHSPQPADRLTALLPVRPRAAEVALLHRYGIDCVYRVAPHTFDRLAAPEEARKHMRAVWSADTAGQ